MTDNILNSFMNMLQQSQQMANTGNKKVPKKPPHAKSSTPVKPQVQNPMQNPMFANMLSQMMSNASESEKIMEKVLDIVMKKIGITHERFEKLCSEGKENQILSLVTTLTTTRSHEFIICTTYCNGNNGFDDGSYGYTAFTGTFKDAKKHALEVLGHEHRMTDGIPNEKTYLVRKYPIYTLQTNAVRVQVYPFSSHIITEDESDSEKEDIDID